MLYEIKAKNKFSIGFKELWEYRELFFFFAWRDIKVKYKQTILGVLWAIFQPLILMLVFTVFFYKGLGVSSKDSTPYPIFAYTGLIFWNVFSSGVLNASQSMINNANIIKKVYFPRLVIPVSSVLTSLFDFFMTLLVYFCLFVYYKYSVSPLLALYIIASLVITSFSTLGIGILMSALNVKYRDFRYVIPFLVQLLFFVSPVIYPTNIIRWKWIQQLLAFNPMSGPIALVRSCLSKSPVNWNYFTASLISSTILLIAGIFFFRKTESYFSDLA